jgi:N-acetylmuramic acid 6-phosphate etherase
MRADQSSTEGEKGKDGLVDRCDSMRVFCEGALRFCQYADFYNDHELWRDQPEYFSGGASSGLSDQCVYRMAGTQKDGLEALSAAGGAAFVLGTLEYAKEKGCATAGITCNPDTPITKACDMPIVVLTGPEVVTGSTRMKAGTAQKLILNMLSTCAMIQTGKVRENLMINVRPTNIKLVNRAVRIIRQLHDCTEEQAKAALEQSGNDVAKALELLEG